jgi:hypothetical protein
MTLTYVLPHYPNMPAALHAHHRLYAYPIPPNPPPPNGFTILDSGAFGLSQRASQIGRTHIQKLAAHYRPYAGQPGYRCIAPDVFLDPAATMRNWTHWHGQVSLPVVPVIQFPRRGQLDLYSTLKQAKFYAPFQPDFICISNPALNAAQSAPLVELCALVRQATGATWLHNLGAGWSPHDIAAWRDLACFDSIDSIAYYTDAQDGWLWRRDGGRQRSDQTWRDLARQNALAAIEIARSQ